jgi:protein TonB
MTLTLGYAEKKAPTKKVKTSDAIKKETNHVPPKKPVQERVPSKPPKIEKKEVAQKPIKKLTPKVKPKPVILPKPKDKPKAEVQPKPRVAKKPKPKIKPEPVVKPENKKAAKKAPPKPTVKSPKKPKPVMKPKPKAIAKAEPKPQKPPKKLKKKALPPKKALEKIEIPVKAPEEKTPNQDKSMTAMIRNEAPAPEFYSESDSSESERENPRLASIPAKKDGAKRPPGSLEEKEPLSKPEPTTLAVPLYKKNPSPKYPRRARRRGYEGTVYLEVLVRQDGKVMDLKLYQSSGHDLLDKAAMKSVKKWVFEPGMKGNRKIDMWVKIPIRFQLR